MDPVGIQSENELQAWLVDELKANGWDAIREVKPDHSDYRIDILALHSDYGRIGIETKFIRPGDGGRVFADACRQITEQYWDLKILNKPVHLWALAPYFEGEFTREYDEEWMKGFVTGRRKFVREFFCRYGIGILRILRDYVYFDYAFSVGEYKIPVSEECPNRYFENVDIDAIRESVRRKRDFSR